MFFFMATDQNNPLRSWLSSDLSINLTDSVYGVVEKKASGLDTWDLIFAGDNVKLIQAIIFFVLWGDSKVEIEKSKELITADEVVINPSIIHQDSLTLDAD